MPSEEHERVDETMDQDKIVSVCSVPTKLIITISKHYVTDV